MQRLKLQKNKIDLEQFYKRGKGIRHSAFTNHAETLIKEPAIFEDESGNPAIIYTKIDFSEEEWLKYVHVLKNIDYNANSRTNGMVTYSRVIGYQPRVTIRRNFCTACSLKKDDPESHKIMMNLAECVSKKYRESVPSIYDEHLGFVNNSVLSEWIIKGTPFTSGIINKTTALKYHYDAGNFKNVRSAMVCFRAGTCGGYLSIPNYGLKFEISDCSLLIFDGSTILHGVTPIIKEHPQEVSDLQLFFTLFQE